jgi:hypothetical protein
MKIKAFVFINILLSIVYIKKIEAQACGSNATPNCTGVKQYTDKPSAQGGSTTFWKMYSPGLINSAGSFTTYTTIRTDVNGQMAVMEEIHVYGPSTGVAAQAQAVVAARTYKLFALSDVMCFNSINPNILNDGCSTTVNPGWTYLQPNTEYKLV